MTFVIASAMSVLVLFMLVDYGVLWFVSPSKEQYPVRGLDVSGHQGEIRWDVAAREGYRFVFIKATEGGDFKDRYFLENWRNSRANGFLAGAYHFFTLCRTGKEQADNFIESVPQSDHSLPPVVDLEYTGNCTSRPPVTDVKKEIRDFLERIEKHYGKRPVLYLTYEFREKYIGDDFNDYPVWIRDLFR